MCAIGQSQNLSIGAASPSSTMLGAPAIGTTPAGPGARRVAGGVGNTMLGGGTGGTPVKPPGGGSGGSRGNGQQQY